MRVRDAANRGGGSHRPEVNIGLAKKREKQKKQTSPTHTPRRRKCQKDKQKRRGNVHVCANNKDGEGDRPFKLFVKKEQVRLPVGR